MSPNKKKKIIILIGIAIFLTIFKLTTNKTTEENIEKYIKNKGFELNEETDIYEKLTSDIDIDQYYELKKQLTPAEYSRFYFDTSAFILFKDSLEYSNGISSLFNGTYDYTTESLTYIYEVSKGNTSIMLNGEFIMKTDEFYCDISYSNNIDPYENANNLTICEKVRYDVENFAEEIRNLITNPSLLDKMKQENK